jgi:type I restriction enzyme S subunit
MSASLYSLKMARLTDLVKDPKDDIVDGPFGSRLKASEYVGEGIPIVRLQNIDRNRFIDKNIKFVTAEKAKEIARHHFVAGDILISKLGDPLGEACIAPDHLRYGILVADVVRVRPDKTKVDTTFLSHALNSASVVAQFTAETKGTTRPRVNLKKIRELEIPLVESLSEQRRIVAEIEKQFTRLEAGVAALKRVQAGLKRYRAAVLKAACEGKLVPTEAEIQRPEGRGQKSAGKFETGEQLLARILAERRAKWQGRGKYKEPAAPDTVNLPPLPEGWIWGTMPQLGELNRGKSKHRPRDDPRLYGGLYPFIQTGDIRRSGGTIREHTQTYSEFGLQQSRLWPEGTLCITIAANIAETGLLGFASCFPDSVVGFVHNGSPATTRYVEFFIRTAKEKLAQFAPATAQKNINLNVLQKVAIPLPPLAEQQWIVAEVERRLSVIEELEAVVSANLRRAARLRQSILKMAFTGGSIATEGNTQ